MLAYSHPDRASMTKATPGDAVFQIASAHFSKSARVKKETGIETGSVATTKPRPFQFVFCTDATRHDLLATCTGSQAWLVTMTGTEKQRYP